MRVGQSRRVLGTSRYQFKKKIDLAILEVVIARLLEEMQKGFMSFLEHRIQWEYMFLSSESLASLESSFSRFSKNI